MIFHSESRIKNQKSESMIKIWFESNFESRIKNQKSESMFSSSFLIQIFYFFLVWQKNFETVFFNSEFFQKKKQKYDSILENHWFEFRINFIKKYKNQNQKSNLIISEKIKNRKIKQNWFGRSLANRIIYSPTLF